MSEERERDALIGAMVGAGAPPDEAVLVADAALMARSAAVTAVLVEVFVVPDGQLRENTLMLAMRLTAEGIRRCAEELEAKACSIGARMVDVRIERAGDE